MRVLKNLDSHIIDIFLPRNKLPSSRSWHDLSIFNGCELGYSTEYIEAEKYSKKSPRVLISYSTRVHGYFI